MLLLPPAPPYGPPLSLPAGGHHGAGPNRRGQLCVVWRTRAAAHYEHMALAQNASVLREAMLSFVQPAQSALNNITIVPPRVCGHSLMPCLKQLNKTKHSSIEIKALFKHKQKPC